MPARALARSAEPYPSPGPRALALAQKAKAARPTDPEALLAGCHVESKTRCGRPPERLFFAGLPCARPCTIVARPKRNPDPDPNPDPNPSPNPNQAYCDAFFFANSVKVTLNPNPSP